jgi:hypothetical protein
MKACIDTHNHIKAVKISKAMLAAGLRPEGRTVEAAIAALSQVRRRLGEGPCSLMAMLTGDA